MEDVDVLGRCGYSVGMWFMMEDVVAHDGGCGG